MTLALCNTCYAEIPAYADPFPEHDMAPTLYKVCPEHGMQRGKLEGDREFFYAFNTYERRNHYHVLIINVTDTCNIKCKYCYYPVKNSWHMPLDEFKATVNKWRDRVTTFIISGGDPTCWEHYFEAAEWCRAEGVMLSQLTNGVRFNDDNFWHKVVTGWTMNGCVLAEMSIHPESITSKEARDSQIAVLHKLRENGLRLSCIMMNVSTAQHSMIELDQAMEKMVGFMQEWRDVTLDFRIRPICFNAWGNDRSMGAKYYLSDLVKSLWRIAKTRGIAMEYSHAKDIDNIYNQNFKLDGISLVTVCAANINDLDLGYLDRGPYMLANDGQPYSVPHAIIINEGIDKGWYNGKRITR